MRKLILETAAGAAVAWLLATGGGAAMPKVHSATPIAVTIPSAPTPVAVDGANRLFYEMRLTNFGDLDLDITAVRIEDATTGATLSTDAGAGLAALLLPAGPSAASRPARRLAGGATATLFMETTLLSGAPTPKALHWRLEAERSTPSTNPAARSIVPIEGELAVDARAPLTIGFPLPPGRWVAANGPSNTSIHRRSLQVVDGRAWVAQRFAIDWVELGPDGRLFHGDKAVNANWYDFGVPVLAVADATVSDSHDGVPENEPSDKRAVPITLETVGGNYLILDLGGGRYAFYAHLQPGSQRVHVGDHVRRGQPLALLGNTGNSDAPHLHFHISNANSPLGAEGLPYVFADYQTLGKAPFDQATSAQGWRPANGATPVTRHDSLPAEDEVVVVVP